MSATQGRHSTARTARRRDPDPVGIGEKCPKKRKDHVPKRERIRSRKEKGSGLVDSKRPDPISFSIGTEAIDDIIGDLMQALEQV